MGVYLDPIAHVWKPVGIEMLSNLQLELLRLVPKSPAAVEYSTTYEKRISIGNVANFRFVAWMFVGHPAGSPRRRCEERSSLPPAVSWQIWKWGFAKRKNVYILCIYYYIYIILLYIYLYYLANLRNKKNSPLGKDHKKNSPLELLIVNPY